jgi:alkylhydroperoxidase family enzyme
VTCLAGRNVRDSEFKAAAAVLGEKQLVDITLAIGLMNAYNRLAMSFRRPPAALTERSSPVSEVYGAAQELS